MSQGYEEYGDEREYADEEYEEAGGLDEAGMDTGFYNKVDGFLSRPSPAVLAGMSSGKGGGKSGKKTKVGAGQSSAGAASSKKGAGNGQNPSSSSRVCAPAERAAAPSSSQQPQLAGGGGGGGVRKPKNTVKSRLNLGLKPKPSSRPLDKELLEEAFMYVYVQCHASPVSRRTPPSMHHSPANPKP